MKNKITAFINLEKSKIILLLVANIIFSELVYPGAKIYVLRQTLELNSLLLSLAVVILYKVPDLVIIFSILLLLFLSTFGIQTGLMVYVFTFYAFLRLLKTATRHSNE